ncbi:MAG: CHAD domain-containing protein [Sphingobacteriales bacterium]|nr:CHAD domain-containing protein [Sphingobacteriales bacterium]
MKSLRKIISAHIKRLQGYIVLMQTGADEDVIHDFRVEFKKIRAVLRLAGKPKIPQLLKQLYASAGRVRELQLQKHAMLKQTTAAELPGYFSLLNNQLSFAVNTLQENAGVNYDNMFALLLKKSQTGVPLKQVKAFLLQKTNTLAQLIQQRNKKDGDIHEIRKQVKDILYSFRTMEQLEIKINITEEDKAAFHTLSDSLGKFQDWVALLSPLKLSMFRSLPENEKQFIRNTRADLMRIKKEAREIIISELNGFLITLRKK